MAGLTDKVRTLFDDKNFAVLSTIEPDGRPHSTVVWVQRDGDEILLALPKNRRKTANLSRDPRAAVTIFDAADVPEQVQGTRHSRTIRTGWSSRSCRASTWAVRIPASPGRTRSG
jgi:hypothetical protein